MIRRGVEGASTIRTLSLLVHGCIASGEVIGPLLLAMTTSKAGASSWRQKCFQMGANWPRTRCGHQGVLQSWLVWQTT